MIICILTIIVVCKPSFEEEVKKELENTIHNFRENTDNLTIKSVNPPLEAIGAQPIDSQEVRKEVPKDGNESAKINELTQENKELKEKITSIQEEKPTEDTTSYDDDIPMTLVVLLLIPIGTAVCVVVIAHFIVYTKFLPWGV